MGTNPLRRWRLILGEFSPSKVSLSEEEQELDAVLDVLFPLPRGVGQGESSPRTVNLANLPHWVPATTLDWLRFRHNQTRAPRDWLPLSPTAPPESNLRLLAKLLALKSHVNEQHKAALREQAKLLVQALLPEIRHSALEQIGRPWGFATSDNKGHQVDWPKTIRANLRHRIPETGWIIPERIIRKCNRTEGIDHIILLLDQSGSMAESMLYMALVGTVLASLPSGKTSILAYDTEVVDLSDIAKSDPIDLLFGLQLGGGNDTAKALRHSQNLIDQPGRTLLFLITDLLEGPMSDSMFDELLKIKTQGVELLILTSHDSQGRNNSDQKNEARAKELGISIIVLASAEFPTR